LQNRERIQANTRTKIGKQGRRGDTHVRRQFQFPRPPRLLIVQVQTTKGR